MKRMSLLFQIKYTVDYSDVIAAHNVVQLLKKIIEILINGGGLFVFKTVQRA